MEVLASPPPLLAAVPPARRIGNPAIWGSLPGFPFSRRNVSHTASQVVPSWYISAPVRALCLAMRRHTASYNARRAETCASLSHPTPRRQAICTSFVPLPCESSQQNHSNTCTSVALFQPLPLFVRTRANPSKVIGYSTFPLLAGRACQRHPYFANALVELALYDDNGCSGISRYRGSPVRGCPTELAEHVCAEVDPLTRVT